MIVLHLAQKGSMLRSNCQRQWCVCTILNWSNRNYELNLFLCPHRCLYGLPGFARKYLKTSLVHEGFYFHPSQLVIINFDNNCHGIMINSLAYGDLSMYKHIFMFNDHSSMVAIRHTDESGVNSAVVSCFFDVMHGDTSFLYCHLNS